VGVLFCNIWLCVCVGFVMCGCVVLEYMGVCMCGFCKVWVCVFNGSLMCRCVVL
jgi:hypothetical protein